MTPLVKKLHAAIRVMNNEEFPRAQQFVTDNQGTYGIVAGASTGIADDVGIPFGQTGEFCGVEPRVHTS